MTAASVAQRLFGEAVQLALPHLEPDQVKMLDRLGNRYFLQSKQTAEKFLGLLAAFRAGRTGDGNVLKIHC
jgi:hypothetical protein